MRSSVSRQLRRDRRSRVDAVRLRMIRLLSPALGRGRRSGSRSFDPIDAAGDAVARRHRSDSRRCAGEDQVARLQSVEAREVGDLLGDRPDELPQVGVLARLAVDCEPDPAGSRMADRGGGMDRRDRGPRRRTPCPAPTAGRGRAPRVAGRAGSCRGRPRSRRHARAPPRGGCSSPPCRSPPPARSRRRSSGRERIGQRAAGGNDCVRRLVEEERRLAVRIEPHLADVVGIVPPGAIDAPHRKAGVGAGDGYGRQRE